MERRTYTGKVISIGGSIYVTIPPELRDGIQAGDILEYEPVAIAPKGQISQTRVFAAQQMVKVKTSAEMRVRPQAKAGKARECSMRVCAPVSGCELQRPSDAVLLGSCDDDLGGVVEVYVASLAPGPEHELSSKRHLTS